MIDALIASSVPLLVLGIVLGGVGHAIALAIGNGPHPAVRLWHRTRTLHPIIVGMLFGLSNLPVPEAMGEGMVARMVWYCLAGVLSAGFYELARLGLDAKIEAKRKRGP